MDLKYDIGNGVTLVLAFYKHWFEHNFSLDFSRIEKGGILYYPYNPEDADDYYTPDVIFTRGADGHLHADLEQLLGYEYYTYEQSEVERESRRVTVALPEITVCELRFDAYARKSMAELISQQLRGEHIDEDEFILAAIKDGVHNVRLQKPCMVARYGIPGIGIVIGSPDETELATCRIDESRYQRDLLTQYKIDLKPVSRVINGVVVTGRDYYISDFMSLLRRSKDFTILPSIGDQSWDHTREYFESHGFII